MEENRNNPFLIFLIFLLAGLLFFYIMTGFFIKLYNSITPKMAPMIEVIYADKEINF